MSSLGASVQERLQDLSRQHRRRRLVPMSCDEPGWVIVDGQRLIDFSSNDYLGLSHHPALKAAAMDAIERWGTGARGSRLVCGHSHLHQQLEEQLMAWSGFERALVFNSGYDANVGMISTLLGRSDTVFFDTHNHASLYDGALMARCKLIRYPHLDLAYLESRLKDFRAAHPHGHGAIVTDSVFSVWGDVAPLPNLQTLADQYGVWLIVDDAHGVGVFGEAGRGVWDHQGLAPSPSLMVMGTFSKALGSMGAYVLGPAVMMDWFINRCRSLIYTTALPPAVIAANQAALQLVWSDAAYQQRCWTAVQELSNTWAQLSRKPWSDVNSLHDSGFGTEGLQSSSQSPIRPWVMGQPEPTMAMVERLKHAGLLTVGLRPPTVPEGQSLLRMTVTAAHTQTMLAALCQALVNA